MSDSGTPVLIDGIAADHVPADDRGLQYGDGLFETLAVVDGRLQAWPWHWQRLVRGAARLGLQLPAEARLLSEVGRVLDPSPRQVVKILLTRGSGGRGYLPPAAPVVRRIVRRYPWPDYPAAFARDGIRTHLCTLRLGHIPTLAGLKHLNRLEQVQARREWHDPAIPEGILRDLRGRVISGTMTNLLWIRGRHLCAPRLDQCGVAGTRRALVLELAPRLGLQPRLGDFPLAALFHADGVFVCNTLAGIWPVAAVADRPLHQRAASRLTGLADAMTERAWREGATP